MPSTETNDVDANGATSPQHASVPSAQVSKGSPAGNDKNRQVVPQTDPLKSLQSLWGKLPWGGNDSTETASSKATTAEPSAPIQPLISSEWLTGAGEMLSGAVQGAVSGANAAVAAAGATLAQVDSSALEGGLAHLRDASDQLARDVRQGVAALQADAARTDTSPQAILSQIRDGTREAFELFVDGAPSTADTPTAHAPWHPEALPVREREYAEALRERMLRLVVDAIYSRAKREALFLQARARADGFAFDAENEPQRAIAVLDADPNVRRLRAGLVPAKLSEPAFWNEYFWHVRHTRRLLLAHNGKLPDEDEEATRTEAIFQHADQKSSDTAAADVVAKEVVQNVATNASGGADVGSTAVETTTTSSSTGAAATAGGSRNWDDEIDAIFDAKHE